MNRALTFGLQIHPDWQRIITRAWSFRFAAALFLGSMGDAVYDWIVNGFSYSVVTALFAGALSGASAVSRVIAQKHYDDEAGK